MFHDNLDLDSVSYLRVVYLLENPSRIQVAYDHSMDTYLETEQCMRRNKVLQFLESESLQLQKVQYIIHLHTNLDLHLLLLVLCLLFFL